MEGHSRRFWFEIMDGDGDGVLNKQDIQELVNEWSDNPQTTIEKETIWIELCDMCNMANQEIIRYQDICNDHVSTFCFQRLICDKQ